MGNFWMGRVMRKHKARAAWIGYNDIKKEKKWVWSGMGNRKFFKSWNRGEPNNYRTEDCVEMFQNGKWNDLACRSKRYFICQKAAQRYVSHRDFKFWKRSNTRQLATKRAHGARIMWKQKAANKRALKLKARAHFMRMKAIRRRHSRHQMRMNRLHARKMRALRLTKKAPGAAAPCATCAAPAPIVDMKQKTIIMNHLAQKKKALK